MDSLIIRSFNFRRICFHFWNKFQQEITSSRTCSRGKHATALVFALTAMSLSLINSKAATLKEKEIAPNVMEALVPEREIEANEATYVMPPESEEIQQSKPTYGWRYFKTSNVLLVKPALVNGKKSRLFFANYGGNYTNVEEVFLAKDGTGSTELQHPPEVRTLIYHNIGKDKEFCGAIIRYQYYDNAGKEHSASKEVKLDDDTANEIINLIVGDSKLKNNTFIKIKEVLTPNLIPVKKYY